MNYQFKKEAALKDEVEVTMLDVKSAAQAYRDREKRDKKPDSSLKMMLWGMAFVRLQPSLLLVKMNVKFK